MRQLDDDVLEVDAPEEESAPRPRQRPRASERLRPSVRQFGFRTMLLPVTAAVAVLALVVGAGFLQGGQAKGHRFALGPVKLLKLKVETFDQPEFAIRFRYPAAFDDVQVRIGASSGARPAAQRAIGLEGDNIIIVTRYNLQRRVTRDNLDEVRVEADKLFSRLAGKDLKGRETEVGGLPAIEYDAFDLARPAKAQSRLLVLFDGVTEYLINCQSLPEQRKQVNEACDVVRDSIEPI